MVSITVSVSPEIRELMKRFSEVNWSGFIKKSIVEKVRELSWRETMLKKLKEEADFDEWAVKAQKVSRKNRFNELKQKGLIE